MKWLIHAAAGTAGLLMVGAIACQPAAAAPPAEECCACIELSGAAQPAIPAFFCGFFPGADKAAAEARCEEFSAVTGDPGLVCIKAGAANCTATLLAEENIACPGAAGAPATSAGALAALMAVLAVAGWLGLRRRARSTPA